MIKKHFSEPSKAIRKTNEIGEINKDHPSFIVLNPIVIFLTENIMDYMENDKDLFQG